MIKRDFHIHTTFCDGKSTPEEIVQKAISLGFKEIGLVCHAFTPCDESYCIKREKMQPFILEITRLKIKYSQYITVYCGVEYDYFAEMSVEGFDFIIGSVHYVCKDGNYIAVDESKESLVNAVNTFYGGDFYEFIKDYFTTLGDMYSKVTPNFIGHFDLVSKFNRQGELFDERDIRYVTAWKNCLDKLLKHNAVFEINIGGIIRGYKEVPYPSSEQTEYIIQGGGKFILNSDSHHADTLEIDYEKYISDSLKKYIQQH